MHINRAVFSSILHYVHKTLNLRSVLKRSGPLPVGSKSDGQKSPSDSVFLRMDEIPYMRTECLKEKEGTGG